MNPFDAQAFDPGAFDAGAEPPPDPPPTVIVRGVSGGRFRGGVRSRGRGGR